MQRQAKPEYLDGMRIIVHARCCERPAPSRSATLPVQMDGETYDTAVWPTRSRFCAAQTRRQRAQSDCAHSRKATADADRGVAAAKWLKRKYPAMPKVLLERQHITRQSASVTDLQENKPQDTVLLQLKIMNSFEKT